MSRLIQSQVKSFCEISESIWPLNNFKLEKTRKNDKGTIYQYQFSNNDSDYLVFSGPHSESIKDFSLDAFISLYLLDKDSEKEELYKSFLKDLKDYQDEDFLGEDLEDF